MARPAARPDAMPAFRNASEKRAWLLHQLAAVEREALLEQMAAGTNDRITIRLRDPYRVEVGNVVLFEGNDLAGLVSVLSGIVDALPLGSVFVVEAGKGGKVLSGGAEETSAPPDEEASTAKRRSRKAASG